MFRYIISLILVNTYCSSGHPVLQNATRFLIAQPLLAVTNVCKNRFLVDLIRSNVEYCNTPVPPFSQRQLECLMLYEISTRLCSQTYPLDFNIKENFDTKIKNIEDVQTLCDNASTWKILHLKDYPQHKLKLERAFNQKKACIKLCSVEDVFNEDSNFYCKFFQWGSELLKTHDTTTAQHQIISDPTPLIVAQNITVSTTLKEGNVTVTKSDGDIKNPEAKTLNSEKSLESKILNTEVSAQAPNNQVSEANVIETNNQKNSQQPMAPSVKTESEKPLAVAEEPPKKGSLENLEPEPVPEQIKDVKANANLEKIKQNVELDEDAENEFGNDPDLDDDPMSEQDAENGNDQNAESDPKLEVEKPKVIEKKIESITSLHQDEGQRESAIFPNPIQDSFSEDDDHFFPFFLTAIILVVVLYILYHNKTKFTKVILGLIVEGRQTGRRRNSRGHSYRRLDTLEQAMSSNTTAPPSKIIY